MIKKFCLVFVVGVYLLLCGVHALASDKISPIGTWAISTGESKFQVFDCGADTICAKLIWLRDDAKVKDNLIYMGHTIVTAKLEGANTWVGHLSYQHQIYQGTFVMTDQNHITMTACAGLCQSFVLVRS